MTATAQPRRGRADVARWSPPGPVGVTVLAIVAGQAVALVLGWSWQVPVAFAASLLVVAPFSRIRRGRRWRRTDVAIGRNG